MSEYRTVATLTAEGTFVVPAPKDLPEGTRAEVTVRVEEAALVPRFTGPDPLQELHAWLEKNPPPPGTAEKEQAMLRQLRSEWD